MRNQQCDFNKLKKKSLNCRVSGEIEIGEWRWKCANIIDSCIDPVSSAVEQEISRICKVVISICQRCLPLPMFFLGMLSFAYEITRKHPSSLPPENY